MLVRCVYASKVASSMSASENHALCVQSQRNNFKMGITGILCWTSDVFVQVLEGGRDPVCELYSRILADKRHQHVRMLSFEDVELRSFGNWSMGHIDLMEANPAIILKYSETLKLDPFLISGRVMQSVLKDLLTAGAISKIDIRE